MFNAIAATLDAKQDVSYVRIVIHPVTPAMRDVKCFNVVFVLIVKEHAIPVISVSPAMSA